jgi:hypothetical protein
MRFLVVAFGLAVVGCGTSSDDTFYCDPSCQASFDASAFDVSLADVRVNDAAGDTSAAVDGGSDASNDADADDGSDANDDGG